MTRDDIIRMAREAGATPYTNRHYPDLPYHTFNPEQLERFVALVAAAEREACAKVCEDMRPTEREFDPRFFTACTLNANAIRARGKT